MQDHRVFAPLRKASRFDRNFFIMLGIDLVLLSLSWYCAYQVRFDFDVPGKFEEMMWLALPVTVAIKVLCLYFFDGYKGMWRFTSVADLLNLIKATVLATMVLVLTATLIYRFQRFPRSVIWIDWCFSLLSVAGARLGIRLYFQKFIPTRPVLSLSLPTVAADGRKAKIQEKKLLIIGAGNCGEKIFREIQDSPQLRYKVVGFLDDNSSKIGKKIHGVPVLGITSDLLQAADKTGAEEVLIAVPSASSQEMRRIVSLCKQSGLRFKTVPSYGELIGGRVSIKTIREVAYRDLIGRDTVKLDQDLIAGYLKGQTILVTGAGGSIGSELCRQICRFEPHTLLLFERAESPLYEIDLELRKAHPDIAIIPVLGDIQDREHLRSVFSSNSPQAIFHAAAYKHVPMLEIQPWKALENNIMGTLNVVNAADEFGTERFVLVSTDKAVKSANVMGASKRIAEMIALNRNGCEASRTRFMAVRFGNVIGSVGSVAPLFKSQIESGGPVTVTHPDVTRYFMTIREASQLILQAGAMGEGGEIFILDMGTPVKIVDMARDLIRLSGFEPDADIKIEFIGLRPGEKLYEELITADENARPTFHPKILMLKGSACDLDLLNGKIHELESLTQTQDALRIRLKLQEIVPDYTPSAPADSYEPVVRGIASAAVVEFSRPGNSIRKGHVRI
jgi:FlaA1/EpsC-like NDP-sugar epimerase